MFIKPRKLTPDSKIATVSLSSGFVTDVQHRYDAAKRQIRETFGWQVTEAPNAFRGSEYLYRNPQARADDLHWALSNPDIEGIISIIGGDDSVRLLPFLDLDLICNNPKVFMGFSDSTITLMQFLRAGVVAFHGPAMLTDLAEHGGIHPYVRSSVAQTLMGTAPVKFAAAPEWTGQRVEWMDPALQEARRQFEPSEGWVWLQGEGKVSGHTIGGCIEVLDMLNGTPGWPAPELWKGAVLCLETSEEAPPPAQVGYWLRNFGAQGILSHANGLLLARPHRYPPDWIPELYGWVKKVLWEYGREDLPVVANMDFGHTSPQMVMPLGIQTELDVEKRTVRMLEAAVD
ncbi:S66 family peptidase [Deinococcus cellulosilyticus]|uniref:LD-carboxypeptidase n=1 Tax=Deinococcus cellulosilyticus (strain DSM 18568 / NBRC 106333 / KACC 11606 / 5516J-15) TaxID=1223518 RepID=A0A511N0W3_DEIC1|nr:S66 peptidase family protein [Deinococcus cellulosilyticus]GEM46505.1 LD-carboxypeptidase [Deinococcus cellulosilyticus NBRC 106333 = KACC 11606]